MGSIPTPGTTLKLKMLTNSYKMPKELKRLLAATPDPAERIMYKHIMLAAHVYAEQKAKQKKEKEPVVATTE